MTRSHFLRAATAVATTSLVAIAILVPSSAATALGSQSISMALLDTATTGVTNADRMLVDSGSHRGYLVDAANKSVKVFDLTSGSLTSTTTIPTTLSDPGKMAIDERGHRLVVGDFGSVAVIDIDPASPTTNQVLKVIATGGDTASYLAIDGDTVFAGDYRNEPNLSRINVRDGAVTHYDVGRSSKSVVIDPVTHTAFVGLPASSGHSENRIATIDPAGLATMHTIATIPYQIALVDGAVLAASETSLTRYDVASWATTASFPSIGPLQDNALAVDSELSVVYAAVSSGIKLVNPKSLAVEGTVPVDTTSNGVTVDRSTHRVFATGTSKVVMWSAARSVQRVSGADRYEVSAAISRSSFAAPAPVVYVASGAVFSDALSASAAAGAKGGAVLLVQKDKIPGAIDAELRRLQPARIIVLGGAATIDASVESALAAYSPSVSRIGGADRFEVSAAVSQEAFGAARPVAYVVAGATFPDALSGSAAVGRLGGPVLLTGKDTLPAAVETEIRRLAPAKIVVLGGANSISQAVVDALTSIQANTSRVAGADRFEVSAAVSAGAFPASTTTAYVASGLVYPDALSGAAAAIATGSPVLLVSTDNIPAAVATELKRLKPNKIILLGGPNSVSPAVEAALISYIVPS